MNEDNASLLGRREFLGSLTVAATGGFPSRARPPVSRARRRAPV